MRSSRSAPASRILAPALLGLAISICGIAPGECAENEGPPALHAGANSLEFSFNTFGDEFSAAIAARHHFSPGLALRLEFEGFLSTQNLSTSEFTVDPGGDGQFESGREEDGNQFGVTTQAVFFVMREERLALGLGVGPYVQWSRSHRVEQATQFGSSPPVALALEDHNSTNRVGAALDANVEWFVAKKLSLRARTGAKLTWNHSQWTSEFTITDLSGTLVQESQRRTSSEGFGFSTLSFGLGLVLYL